MHKKLISFTLLAASCNIIYAQETEQEKFFFAAAHADAPTVENLLKNKSVHIAAKNSAGLTALQLVAQQAVPVEDKWLQLKYLRLQTIVNDPTKSMPQPTQEENEQEQKLLTYLNIAQLLLKAGADKKELLDWDRHWYSGEDVARRENNGYALNYAKFSVDQDETKARKRFVEEQNKLAYFFNTGFIR